MLYNASKYPDDVALLFHSKAPIKHCKPVGHPIKQRMTNPNIGGVSALLNNGSLDGYLNEFPKGTENGHLKKLKKASMSRFKELERLQENVKSWDPFDDPHSKDTNPYATIFVGRLPYDITETILQKTFAKFGQIDKIRLVREKHHKKGELGKPKGYAFIVFADPASSKMAHKEIGVHRGIEINGRICIVDIERGRTVKYFKPRRLGGGLGGRGYTKQISNTRFYSKIDSRPAPTSKFPPHQNEYNRPTHTQQESHYTPTLTNSRYSNTAYPSSTPITSQQPTTSYRPRSARSEQIAKPKREEPDY